jgi:oligopeptide/dipeptide ABC transporter ATP-binding protein
MSTGTASEPLLEIVELRTVFETDVGPACVVDGLNLVMQRGEVLGLVGESGCGKSVTALSILGLVPPPGHIVSGDVRFEGCSLPTASREGMRRLRGNRIAMIFQEPSTSLNPVFTCGEQIAEVLRVHRGCSFAAARKRAVELLDRVHLAEPRRIARRYPHQLSGGMCQRVMIAMALACQPSLLIADEPTTALDVTIQAQILELLHELQASESMAVLLITHDLGVVAQIATRVAVMYAGRIVESGPAPAVFSSPQHPYTRGLLESLPRLQGDVARLPGIAGSVPAPTSMPWFCRFHDRCPSRETRCRQEDPPSRRVGPEHEVRCLVDLPAWDLGRKTL